MSRSLLVVLVIFAALTAACSQLVPVSTGPVVTVEFRGGRCADGECSIVTHLNGDGTVTGDADPPNVMGTMTPGVLARLRAAIAEADFVALASKPFAGTCPTAFDGQEAVFTFHLPSGDIRLASCEVELDPQAPLFQAVAEALRAGEGPSN